MPDRTCKRCSINRVNTLVAAYHRAFQRNEEDYREKLHRMVTLVRTRGFEGGRLLSPGLPDKDLRALCWNVSSFLEDEDINRVLG
ncbi:MAG: hypothetical protein MUF69_09940 [Desulfobacterota bacterium]|jgi:hypothetical protein|nr:hypothetical protein [Thermodesulfobacteriota bacterium]